MAKNAESALNPQKSQILFPFDSYFGSSTFPNFGFLVISLVSLFTDVINLFYLVEFVLKLGGDNF